MTVSAQIIEVIDSLCEKLGIAVDWTSENVWPYIESLMGKYIKFEIFTSIMGCSLSIILTVIVFFVAKYFTPKAKEVNWSNWYFATGAAIVSWVIFGILVIITICVVITDVTDIITCLTFPEKQIFDYIMELTRSEG